MAQLWAEATDQASRGLMEEMVERAEVLRDHLAAAIFGVPKLNVDLPRCAWAASRRLREGVREGVRGGA